MEHACYSINRNGGYVTIYNTGSRYPLEMWNAYKTQHDLKHQEVADLLMKMEQGENS